LTALRLVKALGWGCPQPQLLRRVDTPCPPNLRETKIVDMPQLGEHGVSALPFDAKDQSVPRARLAHRVGSALYAERSGVFARNRR
jgi:hypothetical protein